VDKLDVLGDAQLRTTLLFVRAQAGGVTADDVARALAIPRSVARWRLERLLDARLLEAGFERRTRRSGPGAGRPAKSYRPAPETGAVEFPPRRYERLIGVLAGIVPRRNREQRLAEAGAGYAEELARAMRLRPGGTPVAALRRLCRGLGRLGFHAAVESVGPGHAVLVSATCPLRPLVVHHPEAAAIDEGMWRGLTGLVLGERAGLGMTCSTQNCLAADRNCRILVTFAHEHADEEAHAS
jgi:predicted ArsR family transcriptional regulator